MKSVHVKEIKKTIEELGEICRKIQYGQEVMAELYLEQDLIKISDFLASQEVLLSAARLVKDRLYQILEGQTVTEFLGENSGKVEPKIKEELKNLRRTFLGISQVNLMNERYLQSSFSHGQAILQAIFADSSQYTPQGEMRTGYKTPGRTSGMNHERYL